MDSYQERTSGLQVNKGHCYLSRRLWSAADVVSFFSERLLARSVAAHYPSSCNVMQLLFTQQGAEKSCPLIFIAKIKLGPPPLPQLMCIEHRVSLVPCQMSPADQLSALHGKPLLLCPYPIHQLKVLSTLNEPFTREQLVHNDHGS